MERDILEKSPDIVYAKISKNMFGSVRLYHDKITLLHCVATVNCMEVAELLLEYNTKGLTIY